jgi:F-type H+-transporting ATPase subunit b
MENLGLDTKLIISQVLNFLVFFFIFTKFMAKPFSAYIAKQKEQDEERNRISEALQKRESELKAEQEKTRKQMKKELDEAIARAKEDGEKARVEIIEKAKRDAADIVATAKAQIDQEREELVREMKKRSVDMSVLLVNKGLDDYLSDDAKKSVTKHILEKHSKELNV